MRQRIVRCVAVHYALVSRALFVSLALVDRLFDVRALREDIVYEAVRRLVADLLDGFFRYRLVVHFCFCRYFAGNHQHLVREHNLTGHSAFAVLRHAFVKDAVRDVIG